MGWSEARVTLVPDGWNLVVREIDMRNKAAQTARMVSTEKSLDYSGAVMFLGPVERWLLSRGFHEAEELKAGKSYRRDDLLINAYVDGEEVRNVLLEFALTRDSPRRWPAWGQFLNEFCHAWPVALADSEVGMKVGPEMLFQLLRREISWQDFEQSFGWPVPESGQRS